MENDSGSARPVRGFGVNSKVKMGGMLLGQGSSRYDSSPDSTPAGPHDVYSNPSAPPPPPGPAPKKASAAAPIPVPVPVEPPTAPTTRAAPAAPNTNQSGAIPKAPTAPKTTASGFPPIPPPAPAKSSPKVAPTAPSPSATAPPIDWTTNYLPDEARSHSLNALSPPTAAPLPPWSLPSAPVAPPAAPLPPQAKSFGAPTARSTPAAPPAAPRPQAKPYGVPTSSTPTAAPKPISTTSSSTTSRYAPDGLDYDTMDPDLADMLRKIDQNVAVDLPTSAPFAPPVAPPVAPPAPKAPKQDLSGPPAPPSGEYVSSNPELAAAMKNFFVKGTDKPPLPVCTRPIPSNVNKDAIIRASDSYMAPIIRKFRSVKFQESITIDWDTILSDPIFVKTYPDPTKILGERSGKYAKSFQTSMECWADTMTYVCGSQTQGTPERALVTAIRHFIITADMSLPEDIEPTWKWDAETRVLTTIHNPLSLIDGPAQCYYKVDGMDNGTSADWWPGLYFLLNGNALSLYLKLKYKQNKCPKIDLDTLIPRSVGVFRILDAPGTIRDCEYCHGDGYYINSQLCRPCKGTGKTTKPR